MQVYALKNSHGMSLAMSQCQLCQATNLRCAKKIFAPFTHAFTGQTLVQAFVFDHVPHAPFDPVVSLKFRNPLNWYFTTHNQTSLRPLVWCTGKTHRQSLQEVQLSKPLWYRRGRSQTILHHLEANICLQIKSCSHNHYVKPSLYRKTSNMATGHVVSSISFWSEVTRCTNTMKSRV